MMVDLNCGELAKRCDFWVFPRKDGKPKKKANPMFYHDALSYRHRQNSEKIPNDSKEELNSKASDNLFGCSTAELIGDSLE